MSEGLVRVYLHAPNLDRVMGIIHAVIDLMPPEKAERTRTEFMALPDGWTPLVPWMKKRAIDDDETRSCKLRRCARSNRQGLGDAVVPLLPTIDHFLDSFAANPPEGGSLRLRQPRAGRP